MAHSPSSAPGQPPHEGGQLASLAEAFAAVGSSIAGLTADEAATRLRRDGPNVLKKDEGTHPLAIAFGQFRSPLMVILLAAAGIAFFVGEVNEALIIIAIVLVSSGLGFYQEFRASTAVQALRKRLAVSARVLRGGSLVSVPSSEVVAGDIVELNAGSLVPADGILVSADNLQLDEASLTGESFPAPKAPPGTGPVGDDNLIHLGTSVRSGIGRALIVSTGSETRYGSIAAGVERVEPQTSFARGIGTFGLLMTKIMLVMLALVFPINILLGRPLLESLLFSAALAVGLTPELLPAIVTVTMARGAQQLAKAGVLVRRLVSINNLGAMDVLCTDKTGTLTNGVVTLERACDPSGATSARARNWAGLNARLQAETPNPVDQAILNACEGIELGAYRKLGEVPYDFERKRLSVLVEGPDGGPVLVCKGAVASVAPACTHVLGSRGVRPLDERRRAAEERRLAAWGEQGFRVLAVATKAMQPGAPCDRAAEDGLTLVGYLLFSDPPKPDIATMVSDLARHGVRLKIITGDNRYVAAHVATAVGIPARHLLTGGEIAAMTDRGLARRVAGVTIFAEVTPDQKQRIITALRKAQHVVGYLGDGINDAPALRAADVGISVDSAVDAAKEAADVVLLQQDLGVLLQGILIGRKAFANTLKYITITASANIGNMISMAAASLFLPFLPLLAKQILLNNLLSDLPLLAVSTDNVDDEVVERPGLWNFPRLLRAMVAFGLLSSLFDAITFAVLLLVFHANEAVFQTGWFVVSLLTEVAVVAVLRTRKPFYSSMPSALLIGLSIAVVLFALVLPYLPVIAPAIGLVPLPATLLPALGLIVILYALATEAAKIVVLRSSERPMVPLKAARALAQ